MTVFALFFIICEAALLITAAFSLQPVWLTAAGVFLLCEILAAVKNRVSCDDLSVELNVPAVAKKEEGSSVRVLLVNRKKRYYRRIDLLIKENNLLTGEEKQRSFIAELCEEETAKGEVSFVWENPGTVAASVASVRLYDFFGITCKTLNGSFVRTKKMLVLPELYPCRTEIRDGISERIDYEEYFSGLRGPDLSEVFEYKDYAPGDDIRGISWKLSSKYDNTVVRTGSMPVQRSVLVLLCVISGAGKSSISAAADIVLSAAQSLCDSKTGFAIGTMRESGRTIQAFDITREEELPAALLQIFETEECEQSDAEAAAAECGYARVLIVAAGGEDGVIQTGKTTTVIGVSDETEALAAAEYISI